MAKILLTLLLYLLLPGISSGAGEIRLAVAASLHPALTAITDAYSRSHPGITFTVTVGGSGLLAKQIAQGAPIDLYIAASDEWLAYLEQTGKVTTGKAATLAANRLVFVGSVGTAAALADLPKFRRIALGSPGSVASGRFAEAALRRSGLYEQLAGEGRLVMAQDVRQALVYADRGEVDGAFVFSTDAALAQRVVTLFEVPQALYPQALCPMALTVAGAGNPEAIAFFAALQGAEARAMLERYGFIVTPPGS